MQAIYLIIVICVLFKMIAGYESTSQKIKRMDNDPNCRVKSNDWYKKHPEERGKML